MSTLPQDVSNLHTFSFPDEISLMFKSSLIYNIYSTNTCFYYISFTFSSSVGSTFARNRALVFAMIGLLFLAVGIGVTVSLLS